MLSALKSNYLITNEPIYTMRMDSQAYDDFYYYYILDISWIFKILTTSDWKLHMYLDFEII